MEGYRSQLANSVVMKAPRRAASIASAVGRGIGMLGEAGQEVVRSNRQADDFIDASNARIAEDQKRREGSRVAAEFSGRYAEARVEVERRLAEARKATAPGAAGWDQTVAEIQGEVFQPLLDEYGPRAQALDEELALRLGGMVRSATAETLGREIDWQAKTQSQAEGDSFGNLVDAEGNGLIGVVPDRLPDALKNSMLRVQTALGGTDYDGTTRARLQQMAFEKLTGKALSSLEAQGDYAGLEALVASGQLDPLLGDTKDNWLKTAKAGGAMQVRAAEAAQADALAESLDALETMRIGIAKGDVPTQAAIQAALADARAKGAKDSDLATYGYLGEAGLDAKEFRNASDATLQGERAQLMGLRSAGQLDARGGRRLEALDEAIKGRDIKSGATIRQLASTGAAGQVEAAGQLAGMDPARRWASAREAGQTRLAVYAGLTPTGRAFAAQGRELRAARPDDFLPPKTVKGDGKTQADAMFRQMLGPRLVDELGGAYTDFLDASLDLMAGTARGWDAKAFQTAIQFSFGATWRPGSDNRVLQGGIGTVRGKRVELPDRMTAAEFDSSLARGAFATARYANGQAASKPDILANFTPIPVDGTAGRQVRYRFIDRNGRFLLDDKGNPFTGLFGRRD